MPRSASRHSEKPGPPPRAAITAAWDALPPSEPRKTRVILKKLIRSRTEIGRRRKYEAGAAEELAELLVAIHRMGDEALLPVADEIGDQAREVRGFATSTPAQRTERLWRLTELVDAAERLVSDPEDLELVRFLPLVAPGQMKLFDTAPAATSTAA